MVLNASATQSSLAPKSLIPRPFPVKYIMSSIVSPSGSSPALPPGRGLGARLPLIMYFRFRPLLLRGEAWGQDYISRNRINLLSNHNLDLWLQEWTYHQKRGRRAHDLGGTKVKDSFILMKYKLTHPSLFLYQDHGTIQQFSHTVHLVQWLVQCHCVALVSYAHGGVGAWASQPSRQQGSTPCIFGAHWNFI